MTVTKKREPTPRKLWLRRALKAGLATILLFVLCIFFAGTDMAFQRLWFPLGERTTGAKIGAAYASLSLSGDVELIDVRYEDPAMGISAKINRAEISFSPASLLFGPRPRLTRVEIWGARVVIDEGADGAEETEAPEVSGLPATLLPVAIDRLTLSDLSVLSRVAGIRVEVSTLTLKDLAPGAEAVMNFRTWAEYSPPEEGAQTYSGRFDGIVVLKPSRDARSVNARAEAKFAVEAKPSVNGKVIRRTGIRPPPRGVEGSLTAAFDLVYAPASIRFACQLAAEKLILSDPDSPEASPELAFNMSAEGRLEPEEGRLTLSELSGVLRQEGNDLFRVTLTETIELKISEDSDAESGEKALAEPKAKVPDENAQIAPKLYAEFGPVTVDDLRPWAGFLGIGGLDAAESGRFEANVSVGVTPEGDFIRGFGDLKLSEFNVKLEGADSPIGPLGADANFFFSAMEFEVFTLNELELTATLDDREIAVLKSSGSYDSGKESARLRAHIRFAEPLRTAEAFEAYEEPRGYRVDGGSTEIEIRLDRSSGDAPYLVSAHARSESLRIENPKGMIHESAFVADVSAQIGADWGEVKRIRASVALLDDAQTTTGLLTAGGYWPLAFEEESVAKERNAGPSTSRGRARPSSGRGGKIVGELIGFDVKPWLEILGAKAEATEDEWPASGTFTLEVDARGEVYTFEGEERVGPILVPHDDQAP